MLPSIQIVQIFEKIMKIKRLFQYLQYILKNTLFILPITQYKLLQIAMLIYTPHAAKLD